MKKKTIIGLALAAILVTGCGKVAELENGEDIVASVNNKNITANNLYDEVKAKYARNVLIDMIDGIILDKVYKTDDAMKKNIESTINYYKEQLGDNFGSYIKSQLGINSEEELNTYLLLDYKRNEATKDYLADKLTDTEINDYYKNETVGDIKASHILIKPETTDSMTDDEVAKAEEKAKKLAEEIITKLNNGSKFADLAREYSKDASAANGGDLGWFNKGDMVEPFEKAAYELEVDKYTKTPVKSQYGYHIILKTDQKDKPSLKEAKEDIINALVEKKQSEEKNVYMYKALVELRTKNKLKIEDSELKSQYDSYMKELLGQ